MVESSLAADVAAAYDAVAGEYDSAYTQKKSRAEDRIVLAAIRALDIGGRLVEDLGCGTGFLLDHLRISPRYYQGVDISPGMVARARAKHPLHVFQVGQMERIDTPNASVDVAVSLFGSFSYAVPTIAVQEISRILKPNGQFLVMLLGRYYGSRESYILKDSSVARNLYSDARARELFGEFEDVRVQGLSCLVDALPEWLPQRFFDVYAKVEHELLGWLLPDANYFLMVSGRKRGNT